MLLLVEGGEVMGAEVLVHEVVAVHLSHAGSVTHWKYLGVLAGINEKLG